MISNHKMFVTFFFAIFDFANSNSQWILGEKVLPQEAYLVKSFGAKVEAGNYMTYQLTSGGSLELILKSKSGDADIFISTKSKPTADDYEFSSITCATDSIHISDSLPRPVHISIFGSPYYSVSDFTLDAYMVPPKISYEDVYRANEKPSYEQLVEDHVQLRDHRGDADYTHARKSSHAKRGRGGMTKSDDRDFDEEVGWLDWFLDGDEGWVAFVTIVTGVLKLVLQILG